MGLAVGTVTIWAAAQSREAMRAGCLARQAFVQRRRLPRVVARAGVLEEGPPLAADAVARQCRVLEP